MKKIDNLLEEFVDDFNSDILPDLNEDRENVLFDLTCDDLEFNEKKFCEDFFAGELIFFRNYICDDLENYDPEELPEDLRCKHQIEDIGGVDGNHYKGTLPNAFERINAYGEDIALALANRLGSNGHLANPQDVCRFLADDEFVSTCEYKPQAGQSTDTLVTYNVIQMYFGLVYLQQQEVNNKLDNLEVDDIKDYIEIKRDDIKQALEQQNEIKKNIGRGR